VCDGFDRLDNGPKSIKEGGISMKKIMIIVLILAIAPLPALAAVPEATKFKVALVQMAPAHLDKKANVDKMVSFINGASRGGAKLIVFPELIITGYVGPYAPPEFIGFYQASEPIPGPTTKLIQKVAEEKGVYIIFGMAERGESKLGLVMHNVSVMVGPKGFLGHHRKVHLPGGEKLYFTPGDEIKVFDTEIGRIALLVCYDFWFPESSRIAGLKGAQIIVDSANWPAFDVDPWFALGPGIAASNMLWLVQVNRVGGEPYWPGFGGSQLVNPSGKVMTKGTDKEGIFYGDIDTGEVMQRRTVPPVWFDRRPEIYDPLVKK
jgi:predicted amidohydrolase